MTYDQDPARWTSSPEEAPELLRGAFKAAQDEGPNPAQMRSLALKIAAVSAGGAVAVGAAKATAAGNAAATAATWSVGKLAGVLALAGSIAAGVVVWEQADRKDTDRATPAPRATAPVADESAAPVTADPSPSATEGTGAPAIAGGVEPDSVEGTRLTVAEPADTGAVANPGREDSAATTEAVRPTVRDAVRPSVTRGGRRVVGSSTNTAQLQKPAAAPRTPGAQAETVEAGGARATTELELLRSAQLALRARPREAFRLTEQHRQLYPSGEFAQERDALAIQALLRAGETEMARDLAVGFIKAHPSSPAAHRFREAMGIK